MRTRDLIRALDKLSKAEAQAGLPLVFGRRPERWLLGENTLFRCPNDHVYMGTRGWGVCYACERQALTTYPEDEGGPLNPEEHDKVLRLLREDTKEPKLVDPEW